MTHHRTYHFKADSAPSAKEWVKSLQRVIFRSHNEGDSVKISLPINNVLDVEESQMVEFADTCKIRVIDNDETYAMDEVSHSHSSRSPPSRRLTPPPQYFFSFFEFGKEAINVLKILIEDSPHHAEPSRLVIPPPSVDETGSIEPPSQRSSLSAQRLDMEKIKGTKLQDSVRATLSPISPVSPSPRASIEITRNSFDALRSFGRRSLDVSLALRDESPRRSFSDSRRPNKDRAPQQQANTLQESSDSYVHSLEEPSQPSLSALVASSSDDPSASQILRDSEVFHSPTIHRSASASRQRERDHDHGPRAAVHIAKHPPAGLMSYKSRHAATTGHVVDPGAGELSEGPLPTAPTLGNLSKMGSYPLQRATMYAGWLNQQSRRMSNLLATESMGYVEKVSGMWKGGRKHYDEPSALLAEEESYCDEKDKTTVSMDRFRAHFALPESEKLQATYFGYLMRVLPLYGKVYISDRHFCFRSLLPGTRTKLILPLKDIENVDKEKGFRFGYSGLVVVIRGHEELFFEFGQVEARDDCAITLLQNLEASRYLRSRAFSAGKRRPTRRPPLPSGMHCKRRAMTTDLTTTPIYRGTRRCCQGPQPSFSMTRRPHSSISSQRNPYGSPVLLSVREVMSSHTSLSARGYSPKAISRRSQRIPSLRSGFAATASTTAE